MDGEYQKVIKSPKVDGEELKVRAQRVFGGIKRNAVGIKGDQILTEFKRKSTKVEICNTFTSSFDRKVSIIYPGFSMILTVRQTSDYFIINKLQKGFDNIAILVVTPSKKNSTQILYCV